MEKIRAIKGMPDIVPPASARWAAVEAALSTILAAYAYQQIRMPLVESTGLFQRSIGEVTDIVEKEMYTFLDRKDRSLSLRPEGTAGCVRAAIENSLLDVPQKLWYCGPMFRYENPQKGRQRQFHQIGAEALGYQGVEIELETLLMQRRFWQALGLDEHVVLQINSIGSSLARQQYKDALVSYLERYKTELDADSQRRLQENPLRILDSKVPATQKLLEDAPTLGDYLEPASREHFELLSGMLSDNGIACEVNPRLVRGLDYYNDTVFEWVSDLLGAQATVCAGGRYDGLVEQLGGKPTPAFGFAMGLERLILILESQQFTGLNVQEGVDIYLAIASAEYQSRGFELSEFIRERLPHQVVFQQLMTGSLKSQFKRADKLSAKFVLIVGEREFAEQRVSVKNMASGEQTEVDLSAGLQPLLAVIASQ